MCSIPDQGTRISHAAGHGQQILNIIIIFKVIFLKRNKEIKYSVCLPGSTTYKIVYGLLLLLSHSVLSNSLRPHGLQHTRHPCPSLSPGVCSNSCPWSRWCHPTISSSVIPFFFCLQSFPASGSFLMSQFFTSGGQNISGIPKTKLSTWKGS